MKNLILVLTVLFFLVGCTKDVSSPIEEALTAQQTTSLTASGAIKSNGIKPVRTHARVYFDAQSKEGGRGWYLQVNSFEWEVPVNLPEQFKIDNLLVDVAYVRSEKEFECNTCTETKYMIEITDISVVEEENTK